MVHGDKNSRPSNQCVFAAAQAAVKPSFSASYVRQGLGESISTADLPPKVRRRLEPLVKKMEARRTLRGKNGSLKVCESDVEVFTLFRSQGDRTPQGYVVVNSVETAKNFTVRPQYIVVFNSDGVRVGGWKEGPAGFRTESTL